MRGSLSQHLKKTLAAMQDVEKFWSVIEPTITSLIVSPDVALRLDARSSQPSVRSPASSSIGHMMQGHPWAVFATPSLIILPRAAIFSSVSGFSHLDSPHVFTWCVAAALLPYSPRAKRSCHI